MAILAKVKAVASGDTLVLKSTKSGAEKQLSLAYVSAPRLRREGDEPFAFQSRDYLRKLVVGKDVSFSVLYTVSSREYGLVTLTEGQSLVELLVAEGIVKLREDAAKRDGAADNEVLVEKLRIYEDQARTAGKGLWSTTDSGYIYTQYDPPYDPRGFVEEHKGEPVVAIVERVISADRFAVRLILSPKEHQQLVILLAGIRAPPSLRTDANGLVTPGEEYGDEAKDFVEARLLQRTVHIDLLGVSPQGQIIASIIHPAGNIAELLLAQGFARCVDFHSNLIGPKMARLRDAEQHAKAQKLRLYKTHVVKKKDSNNDFEAVVSRVMSADTLFVRNKAGVERRIQLSSVRQPKAADPSQAPFQADAKEFMRKRLIGKHVRVRIDGKRAAQDNYGEREMATVTIADKNIALQLVENGYASVIMHRQGDEDRSPIWDSLAAAEEVAKKENKGMYSGKAPQSSKMVEASETLQKAKTYLSFLQRQKKVPAIVDFISSGSRFKIIIPKENARLTFILSGIRCPRTARADGAPGAPGEPFGTEAFDYVTKRCWQRDVEIDVENIDRVGGFIGTLWVGRQNIAVGLVEEGLASVHAYSAEQTGHGAELFAAEARAKEARKNMWADWSPEKEAAEQAAVAPAAVATKTEVVEKRTDFRDVVVSNIALDGGLKLQLVGPGTAALESLMTAFRQFHLNSENNTPIQSAPRVGDLVSARFTADKTFYRARIRHVDRPNKEAEVTYVDFGNSEKIPWTQIRPLAKQFSPEKLKFQAIDAVWSFIRLPVDQDYAEDAYEFISAVTSDRQLVAHVDHIRADGVLVVSIYEPDNTAPEASVNRDLVAAGLAWVPAKLDVQLARAYPEKVAALRKAQAEAQHARLGMWKYGDTTPDEE